MSGTILLAEDDKMIQKILSRMIRRAGYQGEIKAHDNADDILECVMLCEGEVDLVLMDTGISSEGDASFFRKLKDLIPNTPIVISSGYSEDVLLGPAHFQGCEVSGILSKPFGLQEVKDLLKIIDLIS